MSYKELVSLFGAFLSEPKFKSFLLNTFPDISAYNILENDYMVSDSTGIEIGFTNEDAAIDDDDGIIFEEGNPIFSHFTLWPKSIILINEFPFGLTFRDKRNIVLQKYRKPDKTTQGNFLGSPFLIDHYKINDIIISISYNVDDMSIKHFMLRDNNLIAHLRM